MQTNMNQPNANSLINPLPDQVKNNMSQYGREIYLKLEDLQGTKNPKIT